MKGTRTVIGRRRLAAVVAVAVALSMVGTPAAMAKTTKKCAKGYVRNKARRCVRKAVATTKQVAATTAKPTTGGAATVARGTIKVGVIGSELNSRGQAVPPEAKQMTQVWADAVNAVGGINGYKFQVIYRRVDGDSARALAALKDLDAQDVQVVMSSDASLYPVLDDYLARRSIPVVGGSPFTSEFDYHPMYFPIVAGPGANNYGAIAAARDVGAHSYRSEYCAEVAQCANSVPMNRYAAQREGIKFSAESASAVATDYTANCLSAKNAGVDYFQSNGLNFANVVRDCARQNYHPIYAQGGAANQSVIDAAKGESVAGNLNEFGIFYDGPEVQRFRIALKRTDFKVEDGSATQLSVQHWLSMEMIGAIAKHLSTSKPSRADFLNAIYTVKGETLDGQIAPMDYSVQKPGTGRHAASDCWTEQIVKDGKYFHMDKSGQTVSRLTFICGTGLTYTTNGPPV